MEQDIQHAVTTLNQGGIVLLPTDTAYGLSCRIDAPDAITRIIQLKKRDISQAVIVLVSNLAMLSAYIPVLSSDVKEKLMSQYWPGPLTIILPCNTDVSPLVTGGKGTIAVRMPGVLELRELIDQVGVPIISTSANVHGEKIPFALEEVDETITQHVDYVFSHAFTHSSLPSTIVDTTQIPWRIIRQGALQLDL